MDDDPSGLPRESVHDTTSLLGLVVTLIRESEARAGALAALLLDQHRKDHDSLTDRLGTLEESVHTHHAKEEREEIVLDARIRPLRATGGWLITHWRDLVIIILGIIAAAEAISRAMGR